MWYDPETGHFFYDSGDQVKLRQTPSGQLFIRVGNRNMSPAKAAHLYMTGKSPSRFLYRDNNKFNFKWENIGTTRDDAKVETLYRYNPENGEVVRIRDNKIVKPVKNSRGTWVYRIVVNKKPWMVTHIIWKIMTGEYPSKFVDHVDGNPLNNRWENLRLATRQQNATNHKLRSDNKTGVSGVDYRKGKNIWRVRIAINGKNKLVGHFKTFEEAVAARLKVEEEHYGEFCPRESKFIASAC